MLICLQKNFNLSILLKFEDFDVVHHTCGDHSLGDANFGIFAFRCDDEID